MSLLSSGSSTTRDGDSGTAAPVRDGSRHRPGSTRARVEVDHRAATVVPRRMAQEAHPIRHRRAVEELPTEEPLEATLAVEGVDMARPEPVLHRVRDGARRLDRRRRSRPRPVRCTPAAGCSACAALIRPTYSGSSRSSACRMIASSAPRSVASSKQRLKLRADAEVAVVAGARDPGITERCDDRGHLLAGERIVDHDRLPVGVALGDHAPERLLEVGRLRVVRNQDEVARGRRHRVVEPTHRRFSARPTA